MGRVTDDADPETTTPRFLDVQTPVIDPRIIKTVIREHIPSVQKPASDIGDTTADLRSNARNSTADLGCEELDMKAVLEKVNRGGRSSLMVYRISRKNRCVDRVPAAGRLRDWRGGELGSAMSED